MYETAFSFATKVERQIRDLSREDFYRRPRHSKLLLEEWYAISRLALHLKHPGLDIFVEAFGDSGIADGRIHERGFRNRTFDVQVTYVGDYESDLRREIMYRQGFTPATGTIERRKKSGDIFTEIAAVDFDHDLKKVASGIVERFNKKQFKNYPENTVLLIAFDEITIGGFDMWSSLLGLINESIKMSGSNFSSVYIINCANNEIVRSA